MKKSLRLFLIFILCFGFSFLTSKPEVFASDGQNIFLSRGAVVSGVIQGFDLKNKQKAFLSDCMQHIDECFFVFGARSHFHQLSFRPVLFLYPDVPPAYRYYDDINTASILDLVQGYPNEKESPFRPRAYMTRIQALKVILAAGDFIKWKERFEVADELGGDPGVMNQQTIFADVNGKSESMWWYPRYVNAALEKKIILPGKFFRPDEAITKGEFDDMMSRALKVV